MKEGLFARTGLQCKMNVCPYDSIYKKIINSIQQIIKSNCLSD